MMPARSSVQKEPEGEHRKNAARLVSLQTEGLTAGAEEEE